MAASTLRISLKISRTLMAISELKSKKTHASKLSKRLVKIKWLLNCNKL